MLSDNGINTFTLIRNKKFFINVLIEIDVKNAKRAVKDKDFMNVRLEEGFKRIVEVVVIESLRQGYHTIGSIVWTTFLDKEDVIKCLTRLMKKLFLRQPI